MASLEAALSGVCRRVLGAGDAPASRASYLVDWLRKLPPNPAAVVCLPSSTEEVAAVLQICNERKVPVVTQGGNTGLTRASVPRGNEPAVLLSTRLMRDFTLDASDSAMICDSGVILSEAQNAAAEAGFVFPLDLGAKGSCTVGGNAATNAGGIHVVRYGSLRANILGLQAVLPSGAVLDELTTLRKDNTGFDVKQMFIGSEGTLGVITRVAVALHPQPREKVTLRINVKAEEDIGPLFAKLASSLGPCLGAFEVMDREGFTGVGNPLGGEWRAVVVVEVLGYGDNPDVIGSVAAIAESIEACEVAESEVSQRQAWQLREELPVKLASLGPIYKYDLSFTREHFFSVVHRVRQAARRLKGPCARSDLEGLLVTGYGHFGDGNVHLNIVDRSNRYKEFIEGELTALIYDATRELRGSISAEHGIGTEKRHAFLNSVDPVSLDVMRQMKRALDPCGIMNPGAIL